MKLLLFTKTNVKNKLTTTVLLVLLLLTQWALANTGESPESGRRHLPAVMPTVNTFPYFEDFDGESDCGTSCSSNCDLSGGWKNSRQYSISGAAVDWRAHAGSTPSSETGPDDDHTQGAGNNIYLYVETSGCNNVIADLVSDQLDFSSVAIPAIEFWYHMYGATMGTIQVDVSTDGGANFTNVEAPFTDNLNEWQYIRVVLGAYAGMSDVRVRIRAVTGSSFTSDMAIDDINILDCNELSIDLTEISLESNNCNFSNNEHLQFSISNSGCLPVPMGSTIDVSYTVNGGMPVNESVVLSSALGAGATYDYVFTAAADFSSGGAYIVQGQATLQGSMAAPGMLSKSFFSGINAFPYSEDFESGYVGWTAEGLGAQTSWVQGTPAKPVINSAHSGTNAWVTGLTDSYVNLENGAVFSPCFDLRNLLDAEVSLWVWWNCEFSWDGAVLQSSIDGGATWQNVGTFGDPNNWYTDNTVVGNPGGSQIAWSGRNSTGNGSGGWVLASHDISYLVGQSPVFFRIAFGTDGSVIDDGFAFDDFSITGTPACPDTDNDGHLDATCGGDDCNDNDNTIYPGAPEICDSKDNNCNGQADETQPVPAPWATTGIGESGSSMLDLCPAGAPQFVVNATGYSPNVNNDAIQETYQTLCGNSSITVHVTSVSGGGWAGITMRESTATGSKMVALKTQLTNFVRREVRSITGGPKSTQQIPSVPPPSWLRIQRSGSIFSFYTSTNGTTWNLVGTQTVAMNSCLLVGMFAESININTTTTATFDNVTVTGSGPVVPLSGVNNPGFEVQETTLTPTLYPNPTNGQLVIGINNAPATLESVVCTVYNTQGQEILKRKINVKGQTESIDLSSYANGVYWVRIQGDNIATDIYKVIKVN